MAESALLAISGIAAIFLGLLITEYYHLENPAVPLKGAEGGFGYALVLVIWFFASIATLGSALIYLLVLTIFRRGAPRHWMRYLSYLFLLPYVFVILLVAWQFR